MASTCCTKCESLGIGRALDPNQPEELPVLFVRWIRKRSRITKHWWIWKAQALLRQRTQALTPFCPSSYFFLALLFLYFLGILMISGLYYGFIFFFMIFCIFSCNAANMVCVALVVQHKGKQPQYRHKVHSKFSKFFEMAECSGLALKIPPKKPQKNHLKKPTKNTFFFNF